jgi:inosine/xanthosine triphosphatase
MLTLGGIIHGSTGLAYRITRPFLWVMQTIAVGSTNPVKIGAALDGFVRMFPGKEFSVRGCPADSGVSAQPMSDAETLDGAIRRAKNARIRDVRADYWVGVEGGCEARFGEVLTFAWVVVVSNQSDIVGKGRTGAFCLPKDVADLVLQGIELGDADDRVFGRSNSKQANGAVGLLTGDVMDRRSYYESAVILALIPMKNLSLRWR